MRLGSGRRRATVVLFAASSLGLLGPRLAHAVDEIQVYNAEINEVGQFSIQQHLNYTITGIPTPAYPGALISNHALNGTPEFAYGVTPWLELGLYVPWAVNEQGQFLSNNFIRVMREAYARVAAQRRQTLRQISRSAGADLVEVSTDGSHLDALIRFFRIRERRLRRT